MVWIKKAAGYHLCHLLEYLYIYISRPGVSIELCRCYETTVLAYSSTQNADMQICSGCLPVFIRSSMLLLIVINANVVVRAVVQHHPSG